MGQNTDSDRGICRELVQSSSGAVPPGVVHLLGETRIELFFFLFEFEFGLDRPSVSPNDSFRPRSHMHSGFHVRRVYSSSIRQSSHQSHRRMNGGDTVHLWHPRRRCLAIESIVAGLATNRTSASVSVFGGGAAPRRQADVRMMGWLSPCQQGPRASSTRAGARSQIGSLLLPLATLHPVNRRGPRSPRQPVRPPR